MKKRTNTIVVSCVVVLLAAVSWPCCAVDQVDAMDAIRQAEADDVLTRNAVYLFLRLAGVVWIAVEWFAALALWRIYRLLRRSLREGGLA